MKIGTRTICPAAAVKRRGIVAVAVIVCLLALTMICGALLRIGLTERRLIEDEERRLQAEWLVESGLERAVARLSASGEYVGETWELSASELNGPAPGVVRIVVATPAAQPARRRVRVEADYPARSQHSVRQSKDQMVELDPGNKTEGERP
jgi:hypothetical protein